jgi:hypothetical protein
VPAKWKKCVKSGELSELIGVSNSVPTSGSVEPVPYVTVWLPSSARHITVWPEKM